MVIQINVHHEANLLKRINSTYSFDICDFSTVQLDKEMDLGSHKNTGLTIAMPFTKDVTLEKSHHLIYKMRMSWGCCKNYTKQCTYSA